jgi:hypothetical protein
VYENKARKKVFRPKRDQVTGGWRKLCEKELSNLYSSPSVFRMIKSRRKRWKEHVAGMGEKRNACGRKGTTRKTKTSWGSIKSWEVLEWLHSR